mgnify:CR=1 FL=1
MTAALVTVVTGAASGIGRATAAHLASRGDHVVLTDLPSDALETAARECRSISVGADVTDEADAENIAVAAIQAYGRIDALVHCAGIEEAFVDADEMPLDVFERTMAVNVTGSFLVARSVGRRMIEQSSGSIVLLGSILSQVGYGRNAAYTTSKGAVLQLGRALAVDWAKHGVRVNVVGPGPVSTPMSQSSIDDPVRGVWLRERIPLGRPATVQDVASVCAFLTSDASAYMTGAYVPVDGGWLAL